MPRMPIIQYVYITCTSSLEAEHRPNRTQQHNSSVSAMRRASRRDGIHFITVVSTLLNAAFLNPSDKCLNLYYPLDVDHCGHLDVASEHWSFLSYLTNKPIIHASASSGLMIAYPYLSTGLLVQLLMQMNMNLLHIVFTASELINRSTSWNARLQKSIGAQPVVAVQLATDTAWLLSKSQRPAEQGSRVDSNRTLTHHTHVGANNHVMSQE